MTTEVKAHILTQTENAYNDYFLPVKLDTSLEVCVDLLYPLLQETFKSGGDLVWNGDFGFYFSPLCPAV